MYLDKLIPGHVNIRLSSRSNNYDFSFPKKKYKQTLTSFKIILIIILFKAMADKKNTVHINFTSTKYEPHLKMRR